jgi:hypothetical protein
LKLIAATSLAFLGSCMAVAPQAAPGSPPEAAPERQFTIYLGQRSLDSTDWSPVDDQPTLGIEFSQESTGSAIGWEVGLAGSSDESGPLKGSTGEIYGGVRKSFGSDTVRPYLGGGLSFINAKAEVGSASDDDSSLAGYVHGGLQFLVSRTFEIGLDLRVLFGSDLEIAGVNTDADYGQAALTFGWRF